MTNKQIQLLNPLALLRLIQKGILTYSQVDTALEQIKAYASLDFIGDQLAKAELKG